MPSSHLNSDLWEAHFHGELLAAVHIRVVGLLEGTLQLMQLVGGEGGAVAPVLFLRLIILARLWRFAIVTLDTLPQLAQSLVTFVTKQAGICSGHRNTTQQSIFYLQGVTWLIVKTICYDIQRINRQVEINSVIPFHNITRVKPAIPYESYETRKHSWI